jgi:hypothetical protein
MDIVDLYGADAVEPELSAALYEVITRFARAIDRNEFELLRSCFHEDAYCDLGPLKGNRDEFMAAIEAAAESMPFAFHGLQGFRVIAHRGERAATETYYSFRSVLAETGMPWEQIGRYVDVMERRRGEWRILRRWTVVEYTTAGVPEFDGSLYPQPSRDRSDPSFLAIEQVQSPAASRRGQ